MTLDVAQERQQAHAFLDRVPAAQSIAIRSLLETMLPDPVANALANAPFDDELISKDETETAARSRDGSNKIRALLLKTL